LTLAALLAADCARWGLRLVLSGPVPFTGLLRAVFHIDQALLVGWRWWIVAGLWATAEAVERTGARPVVQQDQTTAIPAKPVVARSAITALLAVWLTLSAGLAIAYPQVRAELLLGTVYPWIHRLAVVALGIAVVEHYIRPMRAPRGAEYPALVLAAGCACQLLGPWLYEDPVRHWWVGNVVSTITHGAVALVLGWQMWRAWKTKGPQPKP
jgi:hypothetical protein